MKKTIALMLALALFLSLSSFTLAEKSLPEGTLSQNGHTEAEIQQHAGSFLERDMPELIYFDNLSSMMLALKSERVGCIFLSEPVSRYICARNEDVVIAPIATEGMKDILSMAVRAEDTELLDALNAAIQTLTENGEINAMYEKCMADIADDPVPTELPVIEGAKTVRVAVTGDLPPLDYVSADGQAAGFNIELLSAISRLANINFELVMADAGSRTAMLVSGRADVVFWMISRTITIEKQGEDSVTDTYAETVEGLALTDAYLTVPSSALKSK